METDKARGWDGKTPWRYDFEERSDGIYYCTGEHRRHADCEWIKLTAETLQDWIRNYELDRKVPFSQMGVSGEQ